MKIYTANYKTALFSKKLYSLEQGLDTHSELHFVVGR